MRKQAFLSLLLVGVAKWGAAFTPSPIRSSVPAPLMATQTAPFSFAGRPFYYRNRQQHEEDYATVPSTLSVPEEKANEVMSGIDQELVIGMLQSQGVTLLVALMAAAAFGSDGVLMAVPDSLSHPLTVSSLSVAAMTALPMIAIDSHLDQHSNRRDAALMHLSTVHTVATLFGRRHDAKKELSFTRQESLDQAITTTPQALAASMALSLASAASEHYIFRHLIMLHLSLVMPMPLAVLSQALLFGLSHASVGDGGPAQIEEGRLVVATQTLYGAILGACYAVTGFQYALIPILAHALLTLHVTNASWHLCNDQLDWVDANASDNDALSPYYLQRFFYAFDTGHHHALSLHNVHRAVAYAFVDKIPSQETVEALYHELVGGQDDADQGMQIAEFGQLLVALKSRERVG